MTPQEIKENIEDGLVRLQRQYDICFRGFDRPAFKDLAHILRVWVDMRKEVDFYLRTNRPATKFMSYSLNPPLNRYYSDRPYFIIVFPRGVFVSGNDIRPGFTDNASPTGLGSGLHIDSTQKMILSTFDYMRNDYPDRDSTHRVRYVLVVNAGMNGEITTPDIGKLENLISYQKVGFGSWLDSLALRIRGVVLANNSYHLLDITRETLIRRVANSLGASHPAGGYTVTDVNDPILKEMLGYTIHRVPIPYIALLKIAQDILDAFK